MIRKKAVFLSIVVSRFHILLSQHCCSVPGIFYMQQTSSAIRLGVEILGVWKTFCLSFCCAYLCAFIGILVVFLRFSYMPHLYNIHKTFLVSRIGICIVYCILLRQ